MSLHLYAKTNTVLFLSIYIGLWESSEAATTLNSLSNLHHLKTSIMESGKKEARRCSVSPFMKSATGRCLSLFGMVSS